MNRKLILLIILVGALFFLFPAAAHQPRLVYKEVLSQETPALIVKPDVSQAFYGQLKQTSDYYRFDLDQPLKFYFGLLSPADKEERQDFSAELLEINSGRLIQALESQDLLWPSYFEKFAGDKYFKGPEATLDLPAGSYLIKVSNPSNEGKYVLVVGQKEVFTGKSLVETLKELPTLKKEFFGLSPLAAFFNLIGLFALLALAGILTLLFWIKGLFWRRGK